MNPATQFLVFLSLPLSPTTTAVRDQGTVQIACCAGAGSPQLETDLSACDHMSDLPQHSICDDSRKHADGLEGACSNGWNIPASAGKLAYRKRVAKLIFGYRDIAGGRSWAALAQ
jgi:hypothetical protein